MAGERSPAIFTILSSIKEVIISPDTLKQKKLAPQGPGMKIFSGSMKGIYLSEKVLKIQLVIIAIPVINSFSVHLNVAYPDRFRTFPVERDPQF